jgi:uncharacterized protein (TIGR03435 family)
MRFQVHGSVNCHLSPGNFRSLLPDSEEGKMFKATGLRRKFAARGVLALACFIVCHPLLSQTPIASQDHSFDVTSVKAHGNTPGGPLRVDRAGIQANDVSLRYLIAKAYDVRQDDVIDLPRWAENARFDVEGKFSSADSHDDSLDAVRPYLVSLLQERFHLNAAVEMRRLPVYELSVLPGNGKLTRSVRHQPEQSIIWINSRGTDETLHCEGVAMTEFTKRLANIVARDVIDKTELTGRYDFELTYLTDLSDNSLNEAASDIFTSLKEKLGLRLASGKDPVKVIRVVSAESPSPN